MRFASGDKSAIRLEVKMKPGFLNSNECERLARCGSAAAVDILFSALAATNPTQVKVADYALGLVLKAMKMWARTQAPAGRTCQ